MTDDIVSALLRADAPIRVATIEARQRTGCEFLARLRGPHDARTGEQMSSLNLSVKYGAGMIVVPLGPALPQSQMILRLQTVEASELVAALLKEMRALADHAKELASGGNHRLAELALAKAAYLRTLPFVLRHVPE